MSKLKAMIITVLNNREAMGFQALFSAVEEMAKTEKVEIEIGKEKFSTALYELQEDELITSVLGKGKEILWVLTERGKKLVLEETAKAEETRKGMELDAAEAHFREKLEKRLTSKELKTDIKGGPSEHIKKVMEAEQKKQ